MDEMKYLLGTTIDVLHALSYHGATVFEVAKVTGVTPDALQQHSRKPSNRTT